MRRRLPRSAARPPGSRGRERERGFAIIGVVMLVLALTILGLSLFSLSSFESQFLGRSLERQQAFFAASGGLERAKFNLIRGGLREHAGFGLPADGVDSARAWQVVAGDTVSLGAIAWGTPIHIDVYGRSGDTRSAVHATFTPGTQSDFYRRLVTTSGAVDLVYGPPHDQMIRAIGKIYEAGSSAAWVPHLASPVPDSIRHGATWIVPPSVDDLFLAHPSPPPANRTVVGGNPVFTLDAAGLQPGFFTSDQAGSPFDVEELGGTFDILVRGPAVWLLPDGFRAYSWVNIRSFGNDPNTCLVIVAGRAQPPWQDRGIWFEDGGFTSDVPVILVTDGRCIVYCDDGNRDVPYLSVYATGLTLRGPDSGTPWPLRHDLNAPEDQPGGLIDRLIGWGALPNGSAVAANLTFIPGTWRETGN
jgi:hypothetical protein